MSIPAPSWGPPPRLARLRDGEVHVWHLSDASPGSRTAISAVLAGYLGIEAAGVCFTRDDRGKPELASSHASRLRFSLAHGGEIALLAVTEGVDVGVDVEPLRPESARWALVQEALAQQERAVLPSDEAAAAHAFLRSWVRKEALLKAAGVGLAVEPSLVELRGTEIVSLPPVLGPPDAWGLVDLSLPRHVAAVAVEGSAPVLRLFRNRAAPRGAMVGR